MLFALMLGMAMNFLAEGPRKPGIEFTSRHVLRWAGIRCYWWCCR